MIESSVDVSLAAINVGTEESEFVLMESRVQQVVRIRRFSVRVLQFRLGLTRRGNQRNSMFGSLSLNQIEY